jgi:hypothetical protein
MRLNRTSTRPPGPGFSCSGFFAVHAADWPLNRFSWFGPFFEIIWQLGAPLLQMGCMQNLAAQIGADLFDGQGSGLRDRLQLFFGTPAVGASLGRELPLHWIIAAVVGVSKG